MSRQCTAETAPAGDSLVLGWALGVVLLLVAAACSSSSSDSAVTPSATTAATTTATPIVIWFEIESWHWNSPEQMESARVEAADIQESETMLILLPTEGPAGGRIISGDLRITQATPTGEVNASVAVRIEVDGSQSTSSVGSQPSEFATSCDERTDGEWTPRSIRGMEGCQMVQPGGPSFLIWQEGDTTLHAESSLDPETLATWLTTWQPTRP